MILDDCTVNCPLYSLPQLRTKSYHTCSQTTEAVIIRNYICIDIIHPHDGGQESSMPYPVKSFFNQGGMERITLRLKTFFTLKDSEVEDLFCGALSSSEPKFVLRRLSIQLGI